MLIDTHIHLDAAEFDADRAEVIASAQAQGVGIMVVPAVARANFAPVMQLAQQYPACQYALGIHPMYVDQAQDSDLQVLAQYLQRAVDTDKPPVAVGEIGLDFFVTRANQQRQEYFLCEQLKLAKQFNLPVVLHVRRAIDEVLKYLRRFNIQLGIAHAFNGSAQQAQAYLAQGLKLGFGGAMTYERALRIRELAHSLPLSAIVLETDAPDIPPSWLGHQGRNSPDQLPKIAEILAQLKGLKTSEIAVISSQNACQALPNLAHLCTPPQVLL
jgi:TatD DNase family protein